MSFIKTSQSVTINGIVPANASRWVTLAITSFYVFAVCVAFQSIPPILSLIIEDTGISHAQAGLLMSIFTLPGIFIAIPLSIYASRRANRIKAVGLVSVLLVIIGSSIIYFSESYELLLLGRLLIGISASSLPVAGQPVVARAFMNHRLGLAMGIYGILMPISTVLPLVSFGAAGLAWGWRSVILINIVIGIIALIVYSIFFKEPPIPETTHKQSAIKINFRSIFSLGWPVWLIAITWGCFGLGTLSLTTFMPDLMYQNGMDLRIAGSITSIVMLCSLFLSPFTGYLLDKVKYKAIFIIIGAAVTTVFVFLLPSNIDHVLFSVIMIGIFTAPIAPSVSVIVPMFTRPENLSLAFSILFTINNIGFTVGPYLLGFVRDITGSYQTSFAFIALFFLCVTLLPLILIARNRRG